MITGMDGSDWMGGGIFQSKEMELDFKRFLNRPENRPLVEKHQRSEMKKAIKLNEKMNVMEFRDKVLASEMESQRAIQPFLKYPVLRRLVQQLTNDPNTDFDAWASNPRVIELLQTAKRSLDEGRMGEEELEHYLLAMFKHPSHEAHEEFKSKTEQVIRLDTQQLVGALNEHIEERSIGNKLFRSRDFHGAFVHYTKALSIVQIIRGITAADQAQVLQNKQAVLRNIAAVHLETGFFGAAIDYCTQAIDVGGGRDVKGLIRRAKAYMCRHEYEAAQQDLDEVNKLDPLNLDAEHERGRLASLRERGRQQNMEAFSGMFSRPQ